MATTTARHVKAVRRRSRELLDLLTQEREHVRLDDWERERAIEDIDFTIACLRDVETVLQDAD